MKRMLGILAALAALAAVAPAQTLDTIAQIGVFHPTTFSPTWPAGYRDGQSLPFNVIDFGAKQSGAGNQQPGIQAAITAACALVDIGGHAAPPVVFIPAGVYGLNAGLTVPGGCNGLQIKGAGQGTSSLCYASGVGTTMLTVGTVGANVADFTLEDVGFSGFCGGTFPGGLDVVNCNHCHFNRFLVTGYTVFGVRIGGIASGGANGAGFSSFSDCQIQNGQPASFAIVVVTQTGSAGGPDGTAFNSCYINTNSGWLNDSTVAGATGLRSSQSFFANRFEGSSSSPIVAHRGNQQDDRYVGNRWENTGSGGVIDSLSNNITTDPAAYMVGNLWACGSGNCSYVDNATTHAFRIGESMGPSTSAFAPGVLVADATATSSGAGSPVTLKTRSIPAATLNGTSTPFLHIRAWGHTANNANAKTVAVQIASTTLISIAATVSVVDTWQCDVIIGWRANGAAAQSVGGECAQGVPGGTVTTSPATNATITFDPTAAQTVLVQAAVQTSAGDIVQDGWAIIACGQGTAC
jgi:hypothetical protein